MIARKAAEDALFLEKETAQITLNSIGDAVITADISGNITYLNQVAELLTGWSGETASGRPFAEVFHIVDGDTRETVQNPMQLAVKQDQTVRLVSHCVLIRRDGSESAIEDSTAPIHSRKGQVIGAVMVFHDVGEAQAMVLKMTYLAQHDLLTDLPKRLLLDDRITQAISLSHRQSKHLAVLFLDMNGFKQVNDSQGHEIGDKLLRMIAKRAVACVRSSDTVCRLGGDEFVFLLREIADAGDAAVTSEKILAAIAKPYVISERELHLTGSIGISIYPEDGHYADVLIKNADSAMYQAKGKGPSSYQCFEEKINVRDIERQSFERSLCRPGAAGVFIALSAEGRSREGNNYRCRGAHTLERPGSRTHRSGAVRALRRRLWPDCADWPVGPARSMRTSPSLDRCWLAADPDGGQHLRGGASGQGLFRWCLRHPERYSPGTVLSRTRTYRKRSHAG